MSWFRKMKAPDITATDIIRASDENLAERELHSTWRRAERVAAALQEPPTLSNEYILSCTSFPAACSTCGADLYGVDFTKGRQANLASYGLWCETVHYNCGRISWSAYDGTHSDVCPTTLLKCQQCLCPVRGSRNFCHDQCAAKWADEHVK